MTKNIDALRVELISRVTDPEMEAYLLSRIELPTSSLPLSYFRAKDSVGKTLQEMMVSEAGILLIALGRILGTEKNAETREFKARLSEQYEAFAIGVGPRERGQIIDRAVSQAVEVLRDQVPELENFSESRKL